jgi:hypothetical protein
MIPDLNRMNTSRVREAWFDTRSVARMNLETGVARFWAGALVPQLGESGVHPRAADGLFPSVVRKSRREVLLGNSFPDSAGMD